MDEKNNKQTNDGVEKKKKAPLKKRLFKKPVISKRTASAIYMGIAVCMVAMLTVSLLSTGRSVNQSLDELDDISIGIPDISITIPDLGNNSSKPDNKPTGTDNSGVDAEVIVPKPDKPAEEPKTYKRPVSGGIIKGYFPDSLVFSETMQDYRTHIGVDIASAIGENVCAYTDGTISKIEHDPFMGTTVEITHEGGVTTVYKNLAKELPKGIAVGVTVKTGDVIGTVGETAIIEIADDAHLHLEMWVDGECINVEKEIESLK